ncbi:TIGR01440 family protein [Candidatus Soleaferrea massiliensis]|uniref:TIGR01440 family protein n=1 Tax=Candidatus Soleaferrea massiliensis TaxID=1470354 RepID=UPI00058C58A9|nr:TIGR01440 family protein [Candidatus Soleaferrea massiliensis]
MLDLIKTQAEQAVIQLLKAAKLQSGDLFIVGCSTSEVGGHQIGSYSSMEIAAAVFAGIYPILKERGIFLAAQCCEHLGRAIVLERRAAERYHLEAVNVIPQPKAGGSFPTTAYQHFEDPAVVEEIRAHCGMDIGGTLIGMHLKRVAVPVRLSMTKIGEANIVCARTRPKFIGGPRAVYDENLM